MDECKTDCLWYLENPAGEESPRELRFNFVYQAYGNWTTNISPFSLSSALDSSKIHSAYSGVRMYFLPEKKNNIRMSF